MKNYKIFIIYFSLVFLIISIVLTFLYFKNKDIIIDNCNDQNVSYYIKKAIKKKYSGSVVISIKNTYHESRGFYAITKILTLKGFKTEIFKCNEIYHEDQCNSTYLRKNTFYIDSEDEKYDLIRLDSCFYDLAAFNNDKSICYNIIEAETQKHCFAFFTNKTDQ